MKTTHRILTAIAALSLAGVCPAEKPKKEKDGGGKPPEGAAVGALIGAAVGESAAESKKLREKGREKVSKEAGEKAGAKPPKEAAPETGKEKRIAQAIKERLAARQKLGELARKAMELAQAGQHEEAQALRQKLRQLAEKLGDGRPDPMVERFQLFGDNPSVPEKGMPRPPMRPGAPAQPPQAAAPGFRPMPMPPRNAGPRPPQGPPQGPPPIRPTDRAPHAGRGADIAREIDHQRIEHLRGAMENLVAAGYIDLAKAVAQELGALEQQMEAAERARHEIPHPPRP